LVGEPGDGFAQVFHGLNPEIPVSREMILNYVAQYALGLPGSY
jgi:hypothetical protein